MKSENVVEVTDSDDEDVIIQPERQGECSVGNSKTNTGIDSNSSAGNSFTDAIKNEVVNEKEQVTITPKNVMGLSISSVQAANSLFTIFPSDQIPIVSAMKIHQNVEQCIDFDENIISHLITRKTNTTVNSQQSLSSSLPSSNDFRALEDAEIVKTIMDDHPYAAQQAPIDSADSSQAMVNGKSNDQHIDDVAEPEIHVEPIIKVKAIEEKAKQSFEFIDLTSNRDESATESSFSGKSELHSTFQRKKVYNTRNGRNSKSKRQMNIRSSTARYDLECDFCFRHSDSHATWCSSLLSNKKRNKCKVCGKRFIRKGNLMRHHKIHQNQFNCSICYVTLPNAKTHKLHKYNCKFKHFECYLCKKYFCNTDKMFKHMSIHFGKRLWRSAIETRIRSKYKILLKEIVMK